MSVMSDSYLDGAIVIKGLNLHADCGLSTLKTYLKKCIRPSFFLKILSLNLAVSGIRF
jgi:hypothetical protein